MGETVYVRGVRCDEREREREKKINDLQTLISLLISPIWFLAILFGFLFFRLAHSGRCL